MLAKRHQFAQPRLDIAEASAVAVEAFERMVPLGVNARQGVAHRIVQPLRRIAADNRDQRGKRSRLGP
jgi:hypothetical protein